MVILPDTSVWIDFLKCHPSAGGLSYYILEGQAAGHPWVFGELMMGSLGPKRHNILADYIQLPQLDIIEIAELAKFVEEEGLYQRGLSLIDVQILLSCLQTKVLLWTHDQKLTRIAHHYGIDPNPS